MNLDSLLLYSRKRTPSTAQIMQLVLLALIPGTLVMTWYFGAGVLINILWLTICSAALEAVTLACRQKPLRPALADYSAVVTAVLLALSLPPAVPWWLGLTGAFFAIVIAKQLYGGLGTNPFNPAMVGYAVLLIAFPVDMTRWILPIGTAESLPAFQNILPQFLGQPAETMDAFVGATALDQFKQDRGSLTIAEYWQGNPLYGALAGQGWEWINVGFLLGGLYLLYRRLITWHIPFSMLASLSLLALVFYDGGSSASHGSPVFHLFSGAAMLGAFFIATDPVTAPATNTGKLYYGALIGILVFAMRSTGNYPDGIAFAVLLANFAAPAIDYGLRNRTTRQTP